MFQGTGAGTHLQAGSWQKTIKFISPIFGILSLIVSFLLVKKLYSSKIAFYSTIFLAFVPIFIDYSVLSYVESMLTFFVVLSVYFLVKDRIWLSGIAAGDRK